MMFVAVLHGSLFADDYWKCPNNDTQYVTQEAAANHCKTPDLCRQECQIIGREHRHPFGIHSRRHGVPQCKEVCGLQTLPTAEETTVIEKKTTVVEKTDPTGTTEVTKTTETKTDDGSLLPKKNCRKVCKTQLVEDPGLFGQGGALGLGLGKTRARLQEVCTEVCD